MTLKLGNIVDTYERLNTMLDKEMPAIVSYKLTKLLHMLGKEYMAYDVSRNKLLNKYADKNDYGIIITNDNNEAIFKIENKEKFIEEHSELINTDVDIEFKPIPFSEISELQFTVNEIMALENFINEDEIKV